MAALSSEPDGAFTSEELCERIYRTTPQAKHRASVLRAMRGLATANPAIAPLETVPGLGSAIYLSGSQSGGQLARAKLALLNGHRLRIYASPLAPGDEAWLIWEQLRRGWQALPPEQLGEETRQVIREMRRRYSLNFDDACVLLASYGLLASAAGRPQK